jgi:hypothetical protein
MTWVAPWVVPVDVTIAGGVIPNEVRRLPVTGSMKSTLGCTEATSVLASEDLITSQPPRTRPATVAAVVDDPELGSLK